MSDRDDLRAKAEAATPGPWVGGTVCTYTDEDGKRRGAGSVRREGGAIVFLAAQGPEILTADAEFIAAANPAVILGLIDRLERAEKVIADALNHDPLHGAPEGLHCCGGMAPCIRRILSGYEKRGKP